MTTVQRLISITASLTTTGLPSARECEFCQKDRRHRHSALNEVSSKRALAFSQTIPYNKICPRFIRISSLIAVSTVFARILLKTIKNVLRIIHKTYPLERLLFPQGETNVFLKCRFQICLIYSI